MRYALPSPLIWTTALLTILIFWIFANLAPLTRTEGAKRDPLRFIEEIYRETISFGKYPGEDFVQREFFLGDYDDDTYMDMQALILIQTVEGKEKMTIQVTSFEKGRGDPRVKYAGTVGNIICVFEGNRVDIVQSEYESRERNSLLRKILEAIRKKKKLLKKLGFINN